MYVCVCCCLPPCLLAWLHSLFILFLWRLLVLIVLLIAHIFELCQPNQNDVASRVLFTTLTIISLICCCCCLTPYWPPPNTIFSPLCITKLESKSNRTSSKNPPLHPPQQIVTCSSLMRGSTVFSFVCVWNILIKSLGRYFVTCKILDHNISSCFWHQIYKS